MTRSTNRKLTSALLTCLLLTSLAVTSSASDTSCDHNYTVTRHEPTCETKGYEYRYCEICGNSERSEREDRVDHAYSAWERSESVGKNVNVCRFCGKTNGTTVDSDPLYIDLEEDEPYLIVDLVSGTFGDKTAERVDDAVCKIGGKVIVEENVSVHEIEDPMGRRLVSLGEDADELVIVRHAFTVTMLDDGAWKDPDVEMSVKVAFSAGSRRNFTLIRVNEDNEWEEIDYTYYDGELTFKTDASGIFFLI